MNCLLTDNSHEISSFFLNSFLARGNFCYLLMYTANSFYPDQDPLNLRLDLDTLIVLMKEFIEKLIF